MGLGGICFLRDGSLILLSFTASGLGSSAARIVLINDVLRM